MNPLVSVVVPVFNRREELAECLRALGAQSFPAAQREVIVVDDGSTDDSAAVAQSLGARVIRLANGGAPAARNAGIRAASGRWIAFTDSDCMPSRRWLQYLLQAVDGATENSTRIGAAGRTLGYASTSEAARFVDLTSGLDAERHLSHPKWPFAPSGNVLYRRETLLAVGGFDERFCAYDACDLHARIAPPPGTFLFEPRAVVLHRHRDSWSAYARQQRWYGRGLAQFMLNYREHIPWSLWQESRAWLQVLGSGLNALRPGSTEDRLVRRGTLIKSYEQRRGFATTYWNQAQRQRWRQSVAATAEALERA